MEIPIRATVQCKDGLGGRSTCVVVNPITERVTHLVVKEKTPPRIERLVPVWLVKATTHEQIRLTCSRDDLGQLKPFVETEFVQVQASLLDAEALLSYYEEEELVSLPYAPMEHPYSVLEDSQVTVERDVKAVAPGELAVRRGARVEATDGCVGWVDEFVVDPESGHITHLTMRKGHGWGDREISIPISEVVRIAEDVVYLKLWRRQINSLPVVRARRKLR